jgi:hypothetical protein
MGEMAHEGNMRGGTRVVAILIDDELAFGKCPLHEGIVGRRTRQEEVVEAATTTAFVGHATSSAITAVGVPRPPCDPRPTATNAEMGEGGPLGAATSAHGIFLLVLGKVKNAGHDFVRE